MNTRPGKALADRTVADRTVKDRWWVDFGEKPHEKLKRPRGPAGSSFYRSAAGYDQDEAHARLTDLNLKVLQQADPPAGVWAYVQLVAPPFPERERKRIEQLVRLPAYARGVVVDSGRSVRLLVTGTPIGERILELALGEAPSFDCWVDGEWVAEAVYEDAEQALAALRRAVAAYLSPEGIARWRETHPQL